VKPDAGPMQPPSAQRPRVQKTVNLSNLLRTDQQKEEKPKAPVVKPEDEAFTEADLKKAWVEFAEQRKKFQAEFQMLSQSYELRDKLIIVTLLSPVHETMLNNIKSELTSFLRDRLRNNSIQVIGELTGTDEKKLMYTNREKFDYLAKKNPVLKELKDRLGLDTDF
jgi:hypothetical protein